jgi:CDP-glucose 4,6-dehydratase
LIPDAIRAWTSGLPLLIRNPHAVRPWQHVLEPLNGYLLLAEQLYTDSSLAQAYNFGPNTHEAASVGDVIKSANKIFGSGEIVWGEGINGPHEAGLLALNTSKARVALGIKPRWTLHESVSRTMEWYKRLNNNHTAYSLCDADISAFIDTKISV